MKKWELSTPESEYTVHSLSVLVGDDLLTCLWGGTRPHIGAVGVALPRPSLSNPLIPSSTSSVLTLLGHKEDTVVKAVSERLSARLGKNVVVTAGLHWDQLDEDAIKGIVESCLRLADRIGQLVEKEE